MKRIYLYIISLAIILVMTFSGFKLAEKKEASGKDQLVGIAVSQSDLVLNAKYEGNRIPLKTREDGQTTVIEFPFEVLASNAVISGVKGGESYSMTIGSGGADAKLDVSMGDNISSKSLEFTVYIENETEELVQIYTIYQDPKGMLYARSDHSIFVNDAESSYEVSNKDEIKAGNEIESASSFEAKVNIKPLSLEDYTYILEYDKDMKVIKHSKVATSSLEKDYKPGADAARIMVYQGSKKALSSAPILSKVYERGQENFEILVKKGKVYEAKAISLNWQNK